MTTYTISGGRKNTNIGKLISKRYRDCITGDAKKSALNRTAFSIQKDMKVQMPKHLDKPTKQTINSLRVLRAGDRRNTTEDSAFVYFPEFSSEYINPNIVGESITELYGESPIIRWNLQAFRDRRVAKILGIRISRVSGNIVGLRSRNLRQNAIDNPNTFELRFAQDGKLPGLYLRIGDEIITIWTYVDRSPRKAIFPFPQIAARQYKKVFPENWRKSLKECLE